MLSGPRGAAAVRVSGEGAGEDANNMERVSVELRALATIDLVEDDTPLQKVLEVGSEKDRGGACSSKVPKVPR